MRPNENSVIRTKCCVCGRILTRFGWRYETDDSPGATFSHGFCPLCYAKEKMKMEWERKNEDAALYR